MTATVSDAATGLVKFQVIGSTGEYTLYADVINGKAILEDTLPVGDYTVIATYMGDSRFNTNITSGEFTIVGHIKKDTPISASASVNGNRVTLTVNVDENATGFVKLVISGTVANIEVEDGVATLTTILPANSYFVDVTYLGDDNFNMNNTKVTFTITEISKENTTISLDVDVVIGESNITVTAEVDPEATGIVKFEVTGAEEYSLYADVIDGKAVYEDILKDGDYNIIATYMGDSRFNTNVTSSAFTVKGPEKQDTNISIVMPTDVKVGEDIPIKVDIPGATGNVSIIVDSVETVVPLVDGKVNYTVPSITAGNHSVVVIYSGDKTHDGAYKVDSVLVKVLATEITNITIFNDLNISARLVDENGNAIESALITYAVGNVTGKVITAADGSFTIAGAFDVVINIVYDGDKDTEPTNTTITIDKPVLTPAKFDFESVLFIKGYAVDTNAGETGMEFITHLLDVNGNPLSNKTVQLAVNSKVYNQVTNDTGGVHYYMNMVRAGRFTMTYVFLGDGSYNSTLSSVCIDLDKKPIKIKASNKSYKVSAKTKKYTVTLSTIVGSSADGKAHLRTGLKVTMKINGKTYTSHIDSNGQATFNLKLNKKGIYSASINYAGSVTYESASKSVKITVK